MGCLVQYQLLLFKVNFIYKYIKTDFFSFYKLNFWH